MVKDEGLVVHLDGISGRTTILHGLMLKLAEMGLETEFLDKVFQAYFVDQQDICDVYAVANIIEQMKLDEDELKKSDYGIAYKSQLLKLLDENGELGVQGTPFFIFDRTFAMSGAQPVDKLMFIFEQLVERAKRPASVSQSTGEDGKGGQDKLTEGPSLDTATVASATGTTPPSRSPATTSPAAPRYFTPSS
ncbi:hypothetical protein IWQ60_005578 [Tieghemiomyces parasiticus]|uniref:DSBA-like thioredoxin domain-containing protein n=1 Tax=Tieghemiomyces parasiticus TaxID=78921 RepID=A0A9W8AC27_9FUNG|nr:hypothetical protein IWQ60_005578 [Tieghemiomyces parasiticus]